MRHVLCDSNGGFLSRLKVRARGFVPCRWREEDGLFPRPFAFSHDVLRALVGSEAEVGGLAQFAPKKPLHLDPISCRHPRPVGRFFGMPQRTSRVMADEESTLRKGRKPPAGTKKQFMTLALFVCHSGH